MLEYTGSKHDRQIIRKHEFYYEGRSHNTLKFDVLLVRSGTLHRSKQPALFVFNLNGSDSLPAHCGN